jgi:hypothetical protein
MVVIDVASVFLCGGDLYGFTDFVRVVAEEACSNKGSMLDSDGGFADVFMLRPTGDLTLLRAVELLLAAVALVFGRLAAAGADRHLNVHRHQKDSNGVNSNRH